MTSQLPTEADSSLLDQCQETVGYRFSKPELLKAALTHTSGADSRGASNERLEFLGDSVLGLVTCELLYNRFPEYQEGELTKIKSTLVSRKTCSKLTGEIGLLNYLILGKGVINQGEVPTNIRADLFEALVGAIFLDGGWEPARGFLHRVLQPEIEAVAEESVLGNSKSLLQQVVQRQFGSMPRYLLLDEQGPDHDKCFQVAVEVETFRYPAAWGRNKKEAEIKAASNALAAINQQDPPFPLA